MTIIIGGFTQGKFIVTIDTRITRERENPEDNDYVDDSKKYGLSSRMHSGWCATGLISGSGITGDNPPFDLHKAVANVLDCNEDYQHT
ncbi:MAG: hypothetical protein PHG66_00590 [Candidatus Colwellbacteria bacterium]|nr:hypothetical protein [Candidatus Colwellbacteria bacterium]